MSIQTTYSKAHADLAQLFDEVTENQEIVIVTRRGAQDVAFVAAEELASLQETAHLLRSPKNAERLLAALTRAQAGKTRPKNVSALRRELGLGEKK